MGKVKSSLTTIIKQNTILTITIIAILSLSIFAGQLSILLQQMVFAEESKSGSSSGSSSGGSDSDSGSHSSDTKSNTKSDSDSNNNDEPKEKDQNQDDQKIEEQQEKQQPIVRDPGVDCPESTGHPCGDGSDSTCDINNTCDDLKQGNDNVRCKMGMIDGCWHHCSWWHHCHHHIIMTTVTTQPKS